MSGVRRFYKSGRERVRAWWIFVLVAAPLFSAVRTERFQIAGDWCFVMRNGPRTDRAVVILHGNGEVVGSAGSSWETRHDESRLMETLANTGYLVAQSNAAAIPGNGMWGNENTQRAVLALMDRLHRVDHVRHFDAIAISAGNLTLLNLILRGTVFEHVVMLAPVTSLRSLYRCPAGVNRVRQISLSYRFTAASGCPGDPKHDEAFRREAAGYDPTAIDAFSPEQTRVLHATRWMAVYEDGDPKVPPQENILVWKRKLEHYNINVVTRVVAGANTHTGPGLLPECRAGLFTFLRDNPGPK
jgi:hypothetical protein